MQPILLSYQAQLGAICKKNLDYSIYTYIMQTQAYIHKDLPWVMGHLLRVGDDAIYT